MKFWKTTLRSLGVQFLYKNGHLNFMKSYLIPFSLKNKALKE